MDRAVKLRIASEPDLQPVPEICVYQRSVVDAVAAANYGLVLPENMSKDSAVTCRRICKSEPGSNVFLVSVHKLAAAHPPASGARENQCAGNTARARVRSRRTELRAAIVRFTPRLLYIPAQPKIQGQVVPDLPVVLREEREVVGVPASLHRLEVVIGVIHGSQQEARKALS